MTLGAALFASGTAVCVAWGIYAMSSKPSEAFWQWQGWLGAGLLAVGGLCLAVGLLKRDPDSGAPVASAHDQSVVQQTNVGDISTTGGDVDISQRVDNR
jgi:hypothetical protein